MASFFSFQNLKKSWHPSTIKNQERVWKAEQAKAEEERKIAEFQKERREEREQEELQRSVKDGKTANKLDWMYQVWTCRQMVLSTKQSHSYFA